MENFQMSSSIKNIAESLVKFIEQEKEIKKTKKNPFFDAKYADISDVLEAINPVLVECGLSITCFPSGGRNLVGLLLHSSGEYMKSEFDIHAIPDYYKEKKDGSKEIAFRADTPHITPQSLGAALTYARRYFILSVLNLATADDDGNEASGNGKEWLNMNTTKLEEVIESLKKGEMNMQQVNEKYMMQKPVREYIATKADL